MSRYVFSRSVKLSVTEARRRAAVCHGWLYFSSRPATFCWDLLCLVTFRPSSAMSIKFCQGKKGGKIRKRYNTGQHRTQDTTWESNKNTMNITNKSQEVSPFPAGEHKVAMKRQKSMQNTRLIHKRSTALERSVDIFYWRA